MDRDTKRRILFSLLSNWVGKVASTLIQLVQVPIFLHFWSTALFGEWLIVNSIPSYLGFSNIGFGSVAGNEMTMMAGREDFDGALRVFQSCWWLIILLMGVAGTAMTMALVFMSNISGYLKLIEISDVDARWIIFYLGLSILLGQLEQLIQSAYQCIGRYAYGSFIKTCVTLGAFTCTILPVILGYGPRVTALTFAGANILGTLIFTVLVRRDIPWLEFGFKHASMAEIRRLTGPALAFMGFPIGNSLNLQGTILVVQYLMGPTEVVIFATARTVSRIALQMVQMVNSTFAPELSKAFGSENAGLLRTLHRRSCQMAILISLMIIGGVLAGGPWFLHHWTDGHVPPSKNLLFVLLIGVLFYSLWSTSSTVLMSINKHQRLAAWYVGATAITLLVTYGAAKSYGLIGVAASLVLSELGMICYVLPTSLRLTVDTLTGFIGSMAEVPASLTSSTIMRRLSRSKSALES